MGRSWQQIFKSSQAFKWPHPKLTAWLASWELMNQKYQATLCSIPCSCKLLVVTNICYFKKNQHPWEYEKALSAELCADVEIVSPVAKEFIGKWWKQYITIHFSQGPRSWKLPGRDDVGTGFWRWAYFMRSWEYLKNTFLFHEIVNFRNGKVEKSS